MKAKNKKTGFIYENKGAALISVMIAVAFVAIVASSLLYITYTNYQMKSVNLQSKNNSYETNGELTKVTTIFRNDVISASNPEAKIADFYEVAPNAVTGLGSYDITKIVQLTYNTATGTATQATVPASALADGETLTFKTNNNRVMKYKDPTDTHITIYKFYDFEVKHTSKVGKTENLAKTYENQVKTDITLKVQEIPGGANAGGVGEFSMIMDGSLDVATSQFGCLSLYGNTFISSYGTAVEKGGSYYVQPGGPTNPAIHMKNDAKINVIGDYMVVFGDIVLDDNACLYVGKGNLTVYGDIYLNDQSTLICNGSIYMVNEALPGRTVRSSIFLGTGAYEDHVFPKTTSIKEIDWASYTNFCNSINLHASTSGELASDKIGLARKITKKASFAGDNLDVLDWNSGAGSGSSAINGLSGKYIMTADFYGKELGAAINFADKINGGDYNNCILFNIKDGCVIDNSNVNTTIISNKPLKIENVHDIMFTKIGSVAFDYLTAKSSNKYYNDSVHKFQLQVNNGKTDDISLGDFFADDCNATVKKMLTNSIGGGGGDSAYYSSMQFEGFSKDWE